MVVGASKSQGQKRDLGTLVTLASSTSRESATKEDAKDFCSYACVFKKYLNKCFLTCAL